MSQWLFYLLVIIQGTYSVEIRRPADAAVPASAETITQTSNSPGRRNVESGPPTTNTLTSSTLGAVNSHTITPSDFAKKTAAVNNEKSREQNTAGSGTNPSAGELVHPVSQNVQLKPPSNLPQGSVTSSSPNPVAQANPRVVDNSVSHITSSQQLSPGISLKTASDSSPKVLAEQQVPSTVHENSQTNVPLPLQSTVQRQEAIVTVPKTVGYQSQPPLLEHQNADRPQVTVSVNQPTSVYQSSPQINTKMTVEEIIRPAAGLQPQQTSNISPGAKSPPNNPITSGSQNPSILQSASSTQSMEKSNVLAKESPERSSLQHTQALPIIAAENNLLPTTAVSPNASPIKPTITVEEVTPLRLTPPSSSSDLHKEPLQETPNPTSTATKQVVLGSSDDKGVKAQLESKPKERGDTFVTSDSNSANNQKYSVKTEDKGGGIRGNAVEDNLSTMKPLHSLEEIRKYSLTDLANKISSEIKQYRNNVSAAWESEKFVSWTADATSYLKDYMDAILISKSAHNSVCVENDLKKYNTRFKSLKDIVESCKTGVKRDSWNALQDKTSDVLISFDKIVQNATSIIGMLNKESEIFQVVKSAVEDKAKNSICLIDTQLLRKTFSDLKELSIRTDKEQYLKCLDSKPERSMIRETMSDIMRIKNNCV